MSVVDIRDSREERQAILEKVRLAIGQDKRVAAAPALPRAWYASSETTRPIIFYRMQDASLGGFRERTRPAPIDISWREQLVDRVRALNLQMPSTQRIYAVRLSKVERDPEFQVHVLTVSNATADEWLLEKTPGPVSKALQLLISSALATPSPKQGSLFFFPEELLFFTSPGNRVFRRNRSSSPPLPTVSKIVSSRRSKRGRLLRSRLNGFGRERAAGAWRFCY